MMTLLLQKLRLIGLMVKTLKASPSRYPLLHEEQNLAEVEAEAVEEAAEGDLWAVVVAFLVVAEVDFPVEVVDNKELETGNAQTHLVRI